MTELTPRDIYKAFELTPDEIEFIESDADGYRAASDAAKAAQIRFRDDVLSYADAVAAQMTDNLLYGDGFYFTFEGKPLIPLRDTP